MHAPIGTARTWLGVRDAPAKRIATQWGSSPSASKSSSTSQPCFDTFWEHVDEVVLCDTGSRDGTVAEARRYAKARGDAEKLVVGRFKWCDDFAAARTYAHSLATGDVHATIDQCNNRAGASRRRATRTLRRLRVRTSVLGSAHGQRPSRRG